MLSEKDKDRILKLKSLDWTWKKISEAVGATPGACRKFFQRHKAVVDLPPKVKLSKALIQGRLAFKIKQMVQINPSLSYRDIENELKKQGNTNEHVPRWTTIRAFLISSKGANQK